MFAKKSQHIGAPNLIIAITVLIILYILFLPPGDRASLLGDQTTTVTAPSQVINGQDQQYIAYTGEETLIEEVPGTIDYTALNEIEIPLNSFTLFKTVDAEVLEEFNPFYIKNGVGDASPKNLSFEILNLENVNNVILSFTTTKHEGMLTINLNGNTVYQFDISTSTPEPIKLKKDLLTTQNNLEFFIDGVGWQFWKTNEYSFENVKIIGDVTDISRQESLNSFFISEEQGESIENARLEFHPDCATADVGKLTIQLNDRTIFSAVPDCGTLNFVQFAPNMIFIGKNKIDFSTDRGSYLIDLITIELEFEDNTIPVYYFEADSTLFDLKYDVPNDAECGKIDGLCPSPCDEDNDYDCCMQEYTTPNWCVAKTDNEDDRCVGFVTEDNLDRCPTNYVTRNKKVSEEGEDKCGDNFDDECPVGCSVNYDKDCCFDQSGDQFWCDTMPTNGLSYRCENSVSLGQCDICPTGYKGEDESPICSPVGQGLENEELRSEYSVILTMKFTNDLDRKEADVYVNGHLTRLETNGLMYQRDISNFVEPGSNSIEIVPFSILNIRELKVDVVQ